MSIVVSKSPVMVVKPSETVAICRNIELSSFDKGFEKLPVTCLLVFEHPINQPAETIKRALSQALVHYYPIAGRIASGVHHDELSIECSGEGVVFVAASANCTLNEFKLFDQSPAISTTALDKLIVIYNTPEGGCSPADPLLMMQVTEFSCGGFIVGLNWNHAVADGAGMAQFIQAVGELARGLATPSVVPIRFDNTLPSLYSANTAVKDLTMSLKPLELPLLDITIPSNSVNRIKAEFHTGSNGQICTTFEAVIALLWKCRIRAIISNPDAPCFLQFAANLRMHVGAKDGYYGNCSTGLLVKATCGAVAYGDIIDIVKMIKNAMNQIPHQFKKKEAGDQPPVINQEFLYTIRYNILVVSSFQNLGFEEADFGAGIATRVLCYADRMPRAPLCNISPRCNGKDGINVFSRCVRNKHVDAFLAELERFQVILSNIVSSL